MKRLDGEAQPAGKTALIHVRQASESDLEAIGRIQAASPGASQWNPLEYLAHDCRVALLEGRVAGFLAARAIIGPETEILNLAVDPGSRRRGVGRALVADLLRRRAGDFYLEVRESNLVARRFYENLGFRMVYRRAAYYHHPEEAAVVMKLHSC